MNRKGKFLNRKRHPPINKSLRKKIFNLFTKRDTVNGHILCTLCNQYEYFEENSNEGKLTISHLNILKNKYRKYFQTNHEANMTPMHTICNQRLESEQYYLKHEYILIKIIEKNITWSVKIQTVRKERIIDILATTSDKQNIKSELYDGICENYLHTVLQNQDDEIPLKSAIENTAGICKQRYGFGSTKSSARHLDTICNKFNLLYVIEDNVKKITIIRIMQNDEIAINKAMLDTIDTPESNLKDD